VAHKTTMNERNSTAHNGYVAEEHGMRGLVHDITVLSELQAQLFALDAREALRELLLPVAVIAGVAALVFGSLIVGLMTVAYLLIELAGWPHYAGFLTATLVGLAIGAAMLFAVWYRWKNRPPVFSRSKEEFRQNFSRIKGTLTRARGQARSGQTS